MLSSNMAVSIATTINIHLCKHLLTLLCVMVSPWTTPFVIQAHDDRVRVWCMWLPWISRSVCTIRRPCWRTAWRQWTHSIFGMLRPALSEILPQIKLTAQWGHTKPLMFSTSPRTGSLVFLQNVSSRLTSPTATAWWDRNSKENIMTIFDNLCEHCIGSNATPTYRKVAL